MTKAFFALFLIGILVSYLCVQAQTVDPAAVLKDAIEKMIRYFTDKEAAQ